MAYLLQQFFAGQWHLIESFEDRDLADKELHNIQTKGMYRVIHSSKVDQ